MSKQLLIDFQTDDDCQPASEGKRVQVRAYVDSNHPHCWICKHYAYDMDRRTNICRRTGAMVMQYAWCSKWVRG